ncbi:MAG: O-antigen ligase family protein [Abditibacteriales bacterium]|nr:O-antigen ligase family protein [Abditibacteriales bacterium]
MVSGSPGRSLWCPLLLLYFVTMGGTFWGALNGAVRILNQCLTLFLTLAVIAHHVSPIRRAGRDARPYPSHLPPHTSRFTFYASRFTPHLLFALCWLLAAWQSPYPRLAIEGGFQQLWYLLLFFLALAYARRPGNAAMLVSGLLIATTVLVLWGAGQYIAWWLEPQRDVSAGGQRVIRATLNSHNDFAGYMVLLLPLSLFASLNANNGGWRLFVHRARTLLMLACVVLTYSRAGWLGAIVAVAVYVALGLRASGNSPAPPSPYAPILLHSRFLLGCLAVVLIAFSCSPQRVAVQRITGAVSQPAADMGVSGRRMIWRNTLEMIAQRPVWGWGAHLFPLVYPQFVRQDEQRELTFHAHNLFLQYAAEAGIAAALLFVLLVASTLKRAWSKTAPSHPLKIPLTAGVVAYLIYSLFNCCEAIPAIHGTFWMMLGLLAGMTDHKPQDCTRRVGDQWLMVSGLVVCGLVVCWLPFVLKTDLAQLRFEAATQQGAGRNTALLREAVDLDPQNAFYHGQLALALSRDNQRLREAIAHYRRALELCPYDALHRHNLGWCYLRLKRTAEAIAHFQKAIATDKSQPLYYLSLGYALEQTGRDREALRQYETASRLWANAPISHLMKARVLARQGKRQAASAAYQSALDAVRSGRAASGCHIPVRYRRLGFADEVIQPQEWDIAEKDIVKEWESFRGQP